MKKKFQVSKQPDDNTQILISEQKSQVFQGPIPHPEVLACYDEIVPGAAERIVKMAESEMQFRHNKEDFFVKKSYKIAIIGVILAFLSVIVLSSLVFYAIFRGFDTAAGMIAVGSIAAVAGIFVFFKSNSSKNNK